MNPTLGATDPSTRPALLVSIHDVSPLTLDSCRRAVDLVRSASVPPHALTLLVIARHEDRLSLDEHPACCRWLHELVAAGACLAMHGLTHRMQGRARQPWQWAWAHGFARGQAEFYLAGAADAQRRLDESRAILHSAGLHIATSGFVAPAWLTSAPAQRAVDAAGLSFHERLGGIVHKDHIRAPRLIGVGSLNAIEAQVTAAFSRLQALRPAADARFAIHPADMQRPTSMRAIQRALPRLLTQLRPMNYDAFLRTVEVQQP